MAIFAFTDAYVLINSVNLSDHVKSIKLDVTVNQLDPTAMGATYTSALGGLKSGSMQIEFHNDHAVSSVDATLWPILGTVVAFEVRPTSSAVSTTNPKFTGSVLIAGHSMGGSIGEIEGLSVTYPTSGTVTRATS